MQNTLLALVVGLVGGVGGAFAVHHFAGPTATSDGAEVGASEADPYAERLNAIEQELARLSAPSLQGTPVATDGATLDALAERIEALDKELGERVTAEVTKAVEENAATQAEELGSLAARMGGRRTPRKKMNLADASRELGLSAAQEDDVRRAMSDYESKMLGLLAGEDGDTEAVKADLAKLREEPEQAMVIMGKYMPRIFPKMGEFAKLEGERRSAINEAVGPENARKMQREYEIEELQPFGMPGRGFRMRGMGR